MESDIKGAERLGSGYIPYFPPPADTSTAQISRDEKRDAAEQTAVVPPTAQEARAIHGYCNATTQYIDRLRHPGSLPDLEKLKKGEASEGQEEAGEAEKEDATGEAEGRGDAPETEKVKDPQGTGDSQGAQEARDNDAKKEDEEKKKKKQKPVKLGAIFTPMTENDAVIKEGKTVCHVEGTVTGPGAAELDPSTKEALKKVAQRMGQGQVAAGAGIPLAIEDDGTLTSQSMAKTQAVSGGGEMTSAKPFTARPIDESKPFESARKDSDGNEKEIAQKYLKDNPDASDADEVKKKIERLEQREAKGAPGETTDSDRDKETGQQSAAQNMRQAKEPPKVGDMGEMKDSQETKDKKQRDIQIENYFTPLVRAGDVVTPGRSIGHFEIKLTGKDVDTLDAASQERIKQDAMQLVEKGSGRTMGIPQDGTLPADSNMKIIFIASNGKLEGGQRVLSVQGLDGRHPFETFMKEEGGDELTKAKQYLRDNPDAPDADEVKKKVEKLEHERAFGVRDFSAVQSGDENPQDEVDRKKAQ